MPVLLSLRGWAETWLPDDPAMMERDPDVVLGVAGPAGVARSTCRPSPWCWSSGHYEHGRRYWLVLQDGVAPYGCLTDPLLDAGRYVYLRCALPTLLALARGRQGWPDAFADGSLTATGATDLCRRVPDGSPRSPRRSRQRAADRVVRKLAPRRVISPRQGATIPTSRDRPGQVWAMDARNFSRSLKVTRSIGT